LLRIQTLPLPDARFTIGTGNPHRFLPLDTGHAAYNWSFGDGNGSNARTAFHSYAASETGKTLQVSLRVSGKNGCKGTSVQAYQVPDVSSVLPVFWSRLKVFPVPADNVLNVVFDENSFFYVDIMDARGSVLKSVQGKGDLQINVGDIPTGLYMLRVQSAGQVVSQPVYINH
jgi:hypothetical protein